MPGPDSSEGQPAKKKENGKKQVMKTAKPSGKKGVKGKSSSLAKASSSSSKKPSPKKKSSKMGSKGKDASEKKDDSSSSSSSDGSTSEDEESESSSSIEVSIDTYERHMRKKDGKEPDWKKICAESKAKPGYSKYDSGNSKDSKRSRSASRRRNSSRYDDKHHRQSHVIP